MAESTLNGPIVATDITFEEYLAQYASDFHEYVGGIVIKMSPSSLRHAELLLYLAFLLSTYFDSKPDGKVIVVPFVMRLPKHDHGREPDLLIVLNENRDRLHDSYMDGPADICIEIVSPESVSRDHGEKFQEYEEGGVGEYWILDPIHTETRFYRLGEEGLYIRQSEDAEGNYTTPRLPQFRFHIPTLWQDTLPGAQAIVQAVAQMLR